MGRVLVVGAGVVGLSCAVRLLEAGHRVDVLARDLPRETTSAVAAALWFPYLAEPRDRVGRWSAASFTAYEALTDEDAGVRMQAGTQVHAAPAGDPWWRDAVPTLDRVAPPTGWADAWRLTLPVIEMPTYLSWLERRVADLGGSLTRMNLAALPETGPDRPLVVNCTGLGAKHLGADPTLTPVRGQVLYVEPYGDADWWLDEEGPTYVVPREHDVVVGGTEQPGEWSRTADPATAEEILERATRLVPALAGARVLRHKVGLRPARPTVRLERVGDVVHCYGHGGAGVTVAWGCADEVAALVG